MAVARLGLSPEVCLVIEDSERGLHAAAAAGIRCWVIPNDLTGGGDFTSAERVLGHVRDVAGTLRDLSTG